MEYSYSYSGEIPDSVLGLMLGVGVAMMLLALVWYIFILVAGWKMYTKMGEPGWKSIIPIYREYILFKQVWKPSMFWVYLVLMIVTMIPAVGFIGAIGTFVMSVLLYYRLAQCFGHGGGYTVGLILLNPIFTLILGFGKDTFRRIDA